VEDTALEQKSISREQVLMFQRNFKTLVAHYARLKRLPAPLRKLVGGASDRFLTWRRAPGILGLLAKRPPARDQRDQAAAKQSKNGHAEIPALGASCQP